jgi:shikimate kinase
MDKNRSIILTGFMGSGKSAIGRRLAGRLGMPFTDLDREIEAGENRTIPEIFRAEGELAFRILENQYLDQVLSESQPQVLALGGGALQQAGIREKIREYGLLVYLEVPEQVLIQRLKRDRNRPMIRDEKGRPLEDAELRSRVRTLLGERESGYRSADIIVTIRTGWSLERSTGEVFRKIKDDVPQAYT